MKRIFIASPFAGPTPEAIAENVALARRLCGVVLDLGHAPFAPHLLYPQVLDDNDPTQRATGISAGHAWLEACDEVWCWSMDGGIMSAGMQEDLLTAMGFGKPVLYPWGQPRWRPTPDDEFDGLTVLATQPGEPLDLTPRLPLTAQDLRTAIDAAAKPGTFVIRRGPVPTPPKPAQTPIRRSLSVEPMPDDFRDTDVLDPDVADFVAEVDAAIVLSHQLPSKADDFSSSVREKLQSIREWCVSNNAYTEAQQTAVDNMEGGMRRWIR